MAKVALLKAGDIYKEECSKFMRNLVEFAAECCALDTTRAFNRVDLKKSILNATRGRSLTKFVHSLSTDARKDLVNLTSMECPVICPTKRVLLPPIESMPSNIIKSSKKLRNFFGIPELQVCRGCVKRGRCRRYQQVRDRSQAAGRTRRPGPLGPRGRYDRHALDLQNIPRRERARGTGVRIQGAAVGRRDPGQPEPVLQGPQPANARKRRVTRRSRGGTTKSACARCAGTGASRRRKNWNCSRKRWVAQTAQVFNIPAAYNIMPKQTTYMASFQRELFGKLRKRKPPEEEYMWVEDTEDATLPDDNPKLEKINRAEVDMGTAQAELAAAPARPDRIEDLRSSDVVFRMEYAKPLGTEIDLTRYDVINDRAVEGIRVNARGRFEVDLDANLRSRPGGLEYKNDGIAMYRAPAKKAHALAAFIGTLDSRPNDLAFLKRVPYSYQCQSSGEDLRPQAEARAQDRENLEQIALALDAKNS